jgi:hypothetical protein
MGNPPADVDMLGRLSIFQRVMLLWNDLHAYNAVHVVRVGCRLEPARLEGVINDRLERLGLTGLVLDGERRRYHYCGGPAGVKVKVLDAGRDPRAAVAAEVEAQINTRFSLDGPFTPLRFFAAGEGEAFRLGAAYCHFAADADAVRAVVTDIAAAYAGRGGGAAGRLQRYVNPDRHVLPLMLRRLPQGMAGLPRHLADLVRTARCFYADDCDHRNALATFMLPPPALGGLLAEARRCGATLTDLFLAAMIHALAPRAKRRIRLPRRRQLGVAGIAGIRKLLPPRRADAFGMCLAHFAVYHTPPDALPFRRLVEDIHRQTERIKAGRGYLAALADLALSLILMPFHSKRYQQRLYAQQYPQWGGLSNVNMDALIDPRGPVTDYLRAVSTGPACPMIFCVTTFAGALNVAVSYRTAVYVPEVARRVIDGFRDCLREAAEACE